MSERVQEIFDAKIRKVVLAYEGGTNEKTIARQVGVSGPTIAKWLTKEGYKRRKKGRIPLAMKARVRDLHLRDWDDDKIAGLLNLSPEQVAEYSSPQKNPILGGEKDPLKIKGQKKRKKKKTKGKRGRPKKDKSKRGAGWPPPKHRCRKHWTPIEEAYVLELMERKIKPLAIYRRMRASRKRQIKIWRRHGGKGLPPNFPPPKPPPTSPPPVPPGAGEAKRLKAARAMEMSAQDQLRMLEEAEAERQQRIAELEAQAVEEERKIKALEAERKQLIAERKEKARRLEEAKAALKKRELPPGKKKKRKVLPGSFEAEELGIPVGAAVEPGKPGRPALPKPKHLGEYADNGRYFAVSKDWVDLQDASPDELALFADFLTLKKFPARVERSGDQPKAYFDSTWPKKVDSRWVKAVEAGLELIETYRARKKQLASKKMFSRGIANYLAKAYDAYANPKLSEKEKKAAKEDLLDDWARLKKIDRLILIFGMGVSDANGAPTSKGIERGRAAKILLEKEAQAAAKKLAEKKAETGKRRAVQSAEDDEISAILAGGKARLALPEGEEES